MPMSRFSMRHFSYSVGLRLVAGTILTSVGPKMADTARCARLTPIPNPNHSFAVCSSVGPLLFGLLLIFVYCGCYFCFFGNYVCVGSVIEYASDVDWAASACDGDAKSSGPWPGPEIPR